MPPEFSSGVDGEVAFEAVPKGSRSSTCGRTVGRTQAGGALRVADISTASGRRSRRWWAVLTWARCAATRRRWRGEPGLCCGAQAGWRRNDGLARAKARSRPARFRGIVLVVAGLKRRDRRR